VSETPREICSECLVPLYNELCNSYRAIDDFRTKLLGLLPLVTGGGLILLSGQAVEIQKEFFGPIGRLGVLVTLGLLAYELFGIKKCHALIQSGIAMEQEMHWGSGQFTRRPNNLLWVVNEPFAAALIYPAVLGAWIYLALLYEDQTRANLLSISVFLGGFLLVLFYDGFLRLKDRFADYLEYRRSGHGECNRNSDEHNQPKSG
jgi:hypothetical protein